MAMATTAGAGSLIIGVLLVVLGVSLWFQKHVRVFAGIAANILLLVYFKYTGFLVQVDDQVTGADWVAPQIVLPLAISFYTFQQIAYLSDAHDGAVGEHDFLNYCLFITFFPHLIAGPITHHREMLDQFSNPDNFRPRFDNISVGATLFVVRRVES